MLNKKKKALKILFVNGRERKREFANAKKKIVPRIGDFKRKIKYSLYIVLNFFIIPG